MIRSLLFNALYYGLTPVIGLLILPSLLLPDRLYLPFIRRYFSLVHALEKYILGLDYTVEGRHYLPEGPCIIAAKHQSAYETLKLPLLFAHPVVILKKELLRIPFWGWYAAKAGNIGIDRAAPRAALAQMIEGVQKATQLGRTVVIFPQGTRVGIHETPKEKPYKRGIYEIYQTLKLPIIPMAVNTGLYWPRNAFFKKSGRVTIKFLPPLPSGLDVDSFMSSLEQTLETESALLIERDKMMKETRKKNLLWKRLGLAIVFLFVLLYTVGWFALANMMERQIDETWRAPLQNSVRVSAPAPRVHGFPGRFHIKWSGTLSSPNVRISIDSFDLAFWPVPKANLDMDFRGLSITGKVNNTLWGKMTPSIDPDEKTASRELIIPEMRFSFEIPRSIPSIWTKDAVQTLHDNGIAYKLLMFDIKNVSMEDLVIRRLYGSGRITYDENLQPDGYLDLTFTDSENIRDTILANLLSHPMGRSFVTGAINSLMRDDPQTGEKILPLTFRLKNGSVYAGPLKIAYIGHFYWPLVVPDTPAKSPPLTR